MTDWQTEMFVCNCLLKSIPQDFYSSGLFCSCFCFSEIFFLPHLAELQQSFIHKSTLFIFSLSSRYTHWQTQTLNSRNGQKPGASINQITRQCRPFLQSFDANGGRHFCIQWSRKWGSKISCSLFLTFSKGIAAILLQNFAHFSFLTERFRYCFQVKKVNGFVKK